MDKNETTDADAKEQKLKKARDIWVMRHPVTIERLVDDAAKEFNTYNPELNQDLCVKLVCRAMKCLAYAGAFGPEPDGHWPLIFDYAEAYLGDE